MRKLIRIDLNAPVQLDQPLGVQKSISLRLGKRQLVEFEEHKSGDVGVRVIGAKPQHDFVVSKHAIVSRMYDQDPMLTEVKAS